MIALYKKNLICICFVSLLLASTTAEAVLASIKSLGMAATAISYPLDSFCVAYNPAGITLVGDRVDLEGGWLHDRARLKIEDNLVPSFNGKFNAMRTKEFYLGNAGFSKTFFCECFNWSVGVALYNRNFQKTTYNKNIHLFGRSHAGLEYVNETVASTLAISICRWHSFGVAFNWQIERLMVNGLQNFDNAIFSTHHGHVTNRGYDYAYGFSPTIGYRWQMTPHLAIGLVFQPRTHMSKMKKYTGFLVKGRLDIPDRWGIGVSYDIMPVWTICFDAELVKWSRIRSLHNKLVVPTSFDTKLGGRHGSGFGFPDQWYFRAGLEYRIDRDWTLRWGYRHARALPQKGQTIVNALTEDCVEDFMTIGMSWNMNACSEFSWAFAYGFQKRIKGNHSIPISFGGGNANLKERKFFLGAAWGWRF